mmetsp:Transcript_22436/g.62755  ORF Transcript_22436/g.62755 Transcript_22436/m.62755 type:complete len:244 (-) Transcript_22436:91-822(-)|eukprot:CAMPEP_0117524094 /NCGR_PEP_ID=MMETSP0784-20121206/35067_1 /TAXON_ID=39447 /ORGANISM="" /LENGTH=243 /DNA_ID=CAMNT_0005320229 /DNA_START=100 /DNA_END=831 /DNA_ORIENTATION=+
MAHAVQQDRRTRMLASSVNANAKKNGAGGSFTWGGILDVQDYSPVGVTNASKVTVATQAAPMPSTMPVAMAVQPLQVSLQDRGHFPSLSPVAATTTQPICMWGPNMAQAQEPMPMTPAQKLVADGYVRVGTDTFDAQHPRNAFARKPRTMGSSSTSLDSAQQPTVAIDWSASGTIGVQQTILHAAAHPQVMGLCVQQQPTVPLNVLRQTPVTQQHVVPKLSKSAYPTKPQFTSRPMVLQGRGR